MYKVQYWDIDNNYLLMEHKSLRVKSKTFICLHNKPVSESKIYESGLKESYREKPNFGYVFIHHYKSIYFPFLPNEKYLWLLQQK